MQFLGNPARLECLALETAPPSKQGFSEEGLKVLICRAELGGRRNIIKRIHRSALISEQRTYGRKHKENEYEQRTSDIHIDMYVRREGRNTSPYENQFPRCMKNYFLDLLYCHEVMLP